MSTFARYITAAASSAFFFTALLNSQLTYNADMYRKSPEKIEAKVRDNHTNKDNGEFYKFSYDRNMNELDRFYNLVD